MSECLFYDVKELCEVLGVSRATLDRMKQRGEIPGVTRIGCSLRFHKATIHRWINRKAGVEVGV